MFISLFGDNFRPNRFEDDKDEDYHVKMARYCVSDADNEKHREHLDRIKLNKKFYKGDQWNRDEDLEAFLKDETGQDKNRMKVVKNLIRPMVEQYRGNAIRMNFNARARSLSPMAISRKEEKLAEMLHYTELAQEIPEMAGAIKQRFPVGNTREETSQIFENVWNDDYVKAINRLLENVAARNSFEEIRVRAAERMAFSGMAVAAPYEHMGHLRFRAVESENYFWDRSAREYDHCDAEYQGEYYPMLPSEIFERWQDMTMEERKAVENYCINFQKADDYWELIHGKYGDARYHTGRCPVFYTYWKDSEEELFGYIRNEFGEPYLTKIGTEDGYTGKEYTEDDCIPYDELNDSQRKILFGKDFEKKKFHNKKTAKLYYDCWRYCVFIPKEIGLTNKYGVNPNNDNGDIVLEHGKFPFQEEDVLRQDNLRPIYKVNCWAYVDGEVLSPMDDAIDPQRFVNRLLSVQEQLINNTTGSSFVYDPDGVDPDGGEEEIIRNMSSGKPIRIRSRGLGIPNIIGSYDGTKGINQALQMANIMGLMQQSIQEVTGVNSEMKGGLSGGQEQLVGVTNAMINRGSLMQEPFYTAVSNFMLACYQTIATVGKKIYVENEPVLMDMVGNESSEVLYLSKDIANETFRVFIKRDMDDEMLREIANQRLDLWFQMQLIDKETYVNLYNRSNPDDIARELRSKTKLDIEAQRMQAEAQAQQEQAMMQEMQKMQAMEQSNVQKQLEQESQHKIADRNADLEKALIKEMGNMATKSMDIELQKQKMLELKQKTGTAKKEKSK